MILSISSSEGLWILFIAGCAFASTNGLLGYRMRSFLTVQLFPTTSESFSRGQNEGSEYGRG